MPTQPATLGATARAAMPRFCQLFVADPAGSAGIDLDRKTFLARKRVEHELEPELATYFPSLSSRTLVYKGMLTTPQLSAFFPDLLDERFESALLLVHSRFSTNTFPSWPLAHPYRYVAHNGEINTVQGNRNWMRAREAMLDGSVLPGVQKAFPICTPGASDSARFDEVLELLHLGGRPIHHAVLMMIPEAWENNTEMDPAQRAFYRFHSTVMEPWDGPASVAFTDGTVIGAVLDRNGLRPSRYWVTDDDLVVMASEVGVIDIDPSKVVTKGRLQPGRMFLIDTAEGRIVDDEEIKSTLAAEHPYGAWLDESLVELDDLPPREHVVFSHDSVLRRQQVFGYTHEELKIILAPTAAKRHRADRVDGHRHADRRPLGSPAPAVRLLRPAVRPGHQPAARRHPRGGRHLGLLDDRPRGQPAAPECRELPPARAAVPDHRQRRAGQDRPRQRRRTVPRAALPYVVSGLYRVAGGGLALERALSAICHEVSTAIDEGARIIVLSDRNADAAEAPIPSLLLTAAVHHHLVRTKQRTKVGLLVECGDAREVHHMALLIGYGAGAINPYLAFESIEDLIAEDLHGLGGDRPAQGGTQLHQGLRQGRAEGDVEDGRLHGRQSTPAPRSSRRSASARSSSTSTSPAPSAGSAASASTRSRRRSPPATPWPTRRAPRSGPTASSSSAASTSGGARARSTCSTRRRCSSCSTPPGPSATTSSSSTRALVDDQSKRLATLRGLFAFKDGVREPIPIDEVESARSIVRAVLHRRDELRLDLEPRPTRRWPSP